MTMFKRYFPLMAILAVLVGIAHWDEWQTANDISVESQKNKLVPWEEASIDRVILLSDLPGAKDIDLKRVEGEWQITAPISAFADQRVVSDFTQQLSNLKYKKVVATNPEKWAEYGVNKQPKFKIYRGEQELTVTIGQDAPVGMDGYVRVGDDPRVLLVSRAVKLLSTKSLAQLRYKGLTRTAVGNLSWFRYQRAGSPSIEFERNSDKKWQLTEPKGIDLGENDFIDFVTEVTGLGATAIVDDANKHENISFNSSGQPLVSLAWKETKSIEKMVVLEFRKLDDELWAQYLGEDRIYKFSLDKEATLNKSLMDFRDRKVINQAINNVNEVIVDGKHYLLREDQDVHYWLRSEDGAKSDQIASWLVELEYAETNQFISETPDQTAERGTPKHTWILKSNRDAQKPTDTDNDKADIATQGDIVLNLWPEGNNGRWFVKVTGREEVMSISQEVIDELDGKVVPLDEDRQRAADDPDSDQNRL